MSQESIFDTDAAQVVKDPKTGTQFSIAIRPANDVESILDVQDPDDEVFSMQEINVGNQEFTLVFGRTQTQT